MNELKEDVYRIMNEGSCIVTEQLGNKCIDQLMHLIEAYTTRKELEARLDELSGLSVGIDDHCNLEWKERITQLTSQLKEKE